ncbi:23S rRNA (adenine(1618)-N(6))-methyltransferase RlmF [Psychroserpens sp. XS_ASV72]|uniref:23S rRNA (adenine(1618)-N(6))-methyltransferase RlmF n=1 Tax=Psychroserpens sp. XS_ASV72 TaxID=3241293 RepID=UPI003513077C
MHKNNRHSKKYDFKSLIDSYPQLESFVFTNKYGGETLDFADPKAVKALNTALLKQYHNVEYWEFPDQNLCPPIPGRLEYILLLNDLLKSSGLEKEIKVLDIGTGATCIYPLLGYSEFGWTFLASEVDKKALANANQIIQKNGLEAYIELRLQSKNDAILEGVLLPNERLTATMCNPPFFKNEKEAIESNQQKLKGLGKEAKTIQRNFSGTSSELWYPGGEKAFLHNYLFQSSKLKEHFFWYTSLVSKKEHIKSMKISLEKLNATEFKVIEFSLGHKKSRVVAWSFLSKEEQKQWQ